MKSLNKYISESLSKEITELRNKLKNLDKSKIFDGNYNLDDSLDKEFYEILISLNKSNSSNTTLISTWKMLFSKLVVEPLVGELIGDSNCEYSSIDVDRKEKWDIKYNNIYIDVKNTLSDNTHNYSLGLSDIDFIKSKLKDGNRYMLFLDKEIKTWDFFVDVYKRKNSFKLYMISYNDLNNMLENNDYKINKSYVLIPENDIKRNDKVRIKN